MPFLTTFRRCSCAVRRLSSLTHFGLALVAGLLLLAGMTHPVQAKDSYPSHPIRVIFGFDAGSGTDAVVRAISVGLGQRLGTSVIVENKPGANANIAGEYVAHSPADGYTLLYNTSSIAISPHIYRHLAYDVNKDLVPVALTANIPLVMVVNTQVPVSNIQEFVAYLKAHPNKVDFASSSIGNITHLAAASFLNAVHAQAVHIPYKSEAQVLTGLIGGQVQFYFGNANAVIPLVQAGKLKALAVTTPQRIPALPNVPTLSESVSPGMEFGAWSGFMAPAGTPAAIIAKLDTALRQSLEDPALRTKIENTSAQVRYMAAGPYRAFLASELTRWGKAVQAAGVQPE